MRGRIYPLSLPSSNVRTSFYEKGVDCPRRKSRNDKSSVVELPATDTNSAFIADVIATPVVYSAQTLTGALIGTCFFSLVAGFASGFWFSQRLRGAPYPEPSEQRQQLNRLTESSESPGFNNKSINLVLNVPPKNPNGKNANSSAENKPVQKDPTGSGSSSSSSSSDLAESDGRNDDDDDEDDGNDDDDDRPDRSSVENDDDNDNDDDDDDDDDRLARVIVAGCVFDQLTRHDEDAYESVVSEERSLEFLAAHVQQVPYDSRSMSKVTDYGRRYDQQLEYHSACEYTETALTELANGLQDYSSSSSANSLDDLCRGHRRMLNDFNRGDESSTRDHYMVPTRDPRELNERILSLFNPQFLPNFNDMIMYVANQYDARRTPPPRSRSMAAGEDRLFRSSSCRKKRVGASSMFFRRGLAYETARK
ncbi:hypothetical protein E2986_13306 [Frieseomelitta varia]|uniref:Uncharacterized protein n=1 Tax=Frieseomelitta varia TaxID=561572 RepID=A0A833VMA7_9HYME|nr:hypothetical protein E2986_13306 [Frieseomelitta varia]